MKSVIRKLFAGESDEEVHAEFIKYSRGVFENRYVVGGKKQTSKWVIKTGSEFVNFFVKNVLEKASGEIKIKGIIVSTSDIEGDCRFQIENVKKYMGIKQLVIDCTTSVEKILELMHKHPRAFYALSFSTGDYDLKIKAKPPKSGKPGTKTKGEEDEGPKGDFCTLKTSDKKIIEDLFFDYPDFTEINVIHTVNIEKIEIPSNPKTPEEMREKAIRRGTIKRVAKVDGTLHTRETKFIA